MDSGNFQKLIQLAEKKTSRELRQLSKKPIRNPRGANP